MITDYEGERYVVAMLGENTNWVRDVRAADRRAVLPWPTGDVRLEEIPADRRPPILRRYLTLVLGARSHIPIDRDASRRVERLARQVPVFLIKTAPTAHPNPTG